MYFKCKWGRRHIVMICVTVIYVTYISVTYMLHICTYMSHICLVHILQYMWNICTSNITELQIIFESNAYLPPNFLLNADFQNVKLYFHPLHFFAMRKREGIIVLKRISVVCYCVWYMYYIANICFCNTTHYNAKETIDNMSTNGQMDIVNPEF